MDALIYTAMSGAERTLHEQRVRANNLANLDTGGFRADLGRTASRVVPGYGYDARHMGLLEATSVSDREGVLRQTGRELDVAIAGPGYLAVRYDGGEAYTRAGALAVDGDGNLHSGGRPVLGEGGPIQFGATETSFTVASDGTVATDAGPNGRLRIVEFANPQALTRDGSNLFAGGTPTPATGTSVMQGFLERSNVSGVSEMAEMIRVTRSYESLASLTEKQDELRRSAIQRLGDANA